MRSIDVDLLRAVTGGVNPPAQPIQRPPYPTNPTFQTPPGMAPPKYSAGWWDFVRARGIAR
jgi:hypothetical protein